MAHDALVTNSFRIRRGLTVSGTYPMYNYLDESILHMTRDYSDVAQVWMMLAGNALPADFFSLDLQNWLLDNLSSKKMQ